jgi:hypothetical protein
MLMELLARVQFEPEPLHLPPNQWYFSKVEVSNGLLVVGGPSRMALMRPGQRWNTDHPKGGPEACTREAKVGQSKSTRP